MHSCFEFPPHLLSSSLFIADLPNHILEEDIRSIFNKADYPRTNVNFIGKRRTVATIDRALRARIDFPNIEAAEKALALLHQRTVHTPTTGPVPLTFYLTKALDAYPTSSVCPRLLKTPPAGSTEAYLYDLFRPYGPIYSLRIDPAVGVLVQFWAEEHAREAEIGVGGAGGAMNPYDPCSLFISNINFELTEATVQSLFVQFGNVVSTELLTDPKTGNSRGKAFITFSLASEASKALHMMQNVQIHGRPLGVSYRLLKREKLKKRTNKRRESAEPTVEEEGDTLVESDESKNPNEPCKSASEQPTDLASELEHLRKMYDTEVKRRIAAEAQIAILKEKLLGVLDERWAAIDRKFEEDEQRFRVEEVNRAAELEESRRKMQDWQEWENEQKRAKEREQLQREAEEKARWQKLEQEREAEERKRDYEARWKLATETEKIRCLERDLRLFGVGAWTPPRALQRVQLLLDEFDQTKFTVETRPLTFRAIPWPVLADPQHLRVEHITWGAVDAFFEAVQLQMVQSNNVEQYVSLVGKLHRAFHPDRWKARGVLMTVMDEELRISLEAAGNIVAQAMTPIWTESKSYT